jgi:hypothetical protein
LAAVEEILEQAASAGKGTQTSLDRRGSPGGIMESKYNPIVRAFGQIRTALMRCSNISRHDICPGTRLDEILPVEQRRDLWERLQHQGLPLADLKLSPVIDWSSTLVVLGLTVAFALLLRSWLALLVFLPLSTIAYLLTRPWAVHFPSSPKTVGELVIYLISFKDHKGSGYRWTHNPRRSTRDNR